MKADLEIKQKKIQTKHAGLEESCRTQVWSSRQFWFNWLKSPKEIQLKLGIFGFWNGFLEEQKIDYSNRRPFWKNHAALKICFLLKKLTSPLPLWCFWRWWFSKKLAIWWDRFVPPGFQGSMVSPVTLLESLKAILNNPSDTWLRFRTL